MKVEGTSLNTWFNCYETAFLGEDNWRETMLQEEKVLLRPSQWRMGWTFCCTNASASLKIEPLPMHHSQTPQHSRHGMWTRPGHVACGGPVQKLGSQGSSWNGYVRCLYIQWRSTFYQLPEGAFWWTVPQHTFQPLWNDGDAECDITKVKFLPETQTSFAVYGPALQYMDHLICNFQKRYPEVLFIRYFNVTEKMPLTLRKFWRNIQYPPLYQPHYQSLGRCYIPDLQLSLEETVARMSLNLGLKDK